MRHILSAVIIFIMLLSLVACSSADTMTNPPDIPVSATPEQTVDADLTDVMEELTPDPTPTPDDDQISVLQTPNLSLTTEGMMLLEYLHNIIIPEKGIVESTTTAEIPSGSWGSYRWCKTEGVAGATLSDLDGDGQVELIVLTITNGHRSNYSDALYSNLNLLIYSISDNVPVLVTEKIIAEHFDALVSYIEVIIQSYEGNESNYIFCYWHQYGILVDWFEGRYDVFSFNGSEIITELSVERLPSTSSIMLVKTTQNDRPIILYDWYYFFYRDNYIEHGLYYESYVSWSNTLHTNYEFPENGMYECYLDAIKTELSPFGIDVEGNENELWDGIITSVRFPGLDDKVCIIDADGNWGSDFSYATVVATYTFSIPTAD